MPEGRFPVHDESPEVSFGNCWRSAAFTARRRGEREEENARLSRQHVACFGLAQFITHAAAFAEQQLDTRRQRHQLVQR